MPPAALRRPWPCDGGEVLVLCEGANGIALCVLREDTPPTRLIADKGVDVARSTRVAHQVCPRSPGQIAGPPVRRSPALAVLHLDLVGRRAVRSAPIKLDQ